jgi:hypothetical protein
LSLSSNERAGADFTPVWWMVIFLMTWLFAPASRGFAPQASLETIGGSGTGYELDKRTESKRPFMNLS